MSTGFNYRRVEHQYYPEIAEVQDSGNFGLESYRGVNRRFMWVHTESGYSTCIVLTPQVNGWSITCSDFEYDLKKINKIVDKFLDAETTSVREIDYKEFKENYDIILSRYLQSKQEVNQ